jgi:acyl-coenzyme A thioesterase PaaI-like protein
VTISHHDLCFGCGVANLFGLQMELERQPDGAVAGRFFVKQDHQGPPGNAHSGVIAAALDEAMSLAVEAEGIYALTARLEVDLKAPLPLGTFVRAEARIVERGEGRLVLRAELSVDGHDGQRVAEGKAIFVERP